MKWVESPSGGNGGYGWIDKHIEAFVPIGAPFLGVPKAVSSLISGEMKDTAEMNPVLTYLKERVFTKLDIMNFLRSFRSVGGLLPKGGRCIWGEGNSAPDDQAISASFAEASRTNAEKFDSIIAQVMEYTSSLFATEEEKSEAEIKPEELFDEREDNETISTIVENDNLKKEGALLNSKEPRSSSFMNSKSILTFTIEPELEQIMTHLQNQWRAMNKLQPLNDEILQKIKERAQILLVFK